MAKTVFDRLPYQEPMAPADVGKRIRGLGPLYRVGIGLAAITGTIHLALGLANLGDPLGLSFVLAGFGFFGAIALVVGEVHRRLVVAAGIPYTGAQIGAWYALNRPAGVNDLTAVEALDKLVQAALIIVLVILLIRES